MKKSIFFFILLFFCIKMQAQNCPPSIGMPYPPDFEVRSMAEWEELGALLLTWRVTNAYPGTDRVLAEIAKNAQSECEVIIACDNINLVAQAKASLLSFGVNIDQNITFLVANNNSIWARDYAPNTVYKTENNQRLLVDWIYDNLIRVKDDTIAVALATYLNVPLYSMTDSFRLVNVGGNFMTDGLGNAFSTRLVIDKNTLNTDLCVDLSEDEIDDFHQSFMGIKNYRKIARLPYDSLDHLDMHWKMLDETTFLVNKYPDNVSNSSIMEANVANFVQDFKTPFNTNYRMVRMPMSPDLEGDFPQSETDSFRTYTNAIFVNKKILVPTYNSIFDSLALAIWRLEKPGYQVVGINSGALIRRNGALHCVAKEIGTNDPLPIQHGNNACSQLTTQGILMEVFAQHSSGIEAVSLFWKKENALNWLEIEMTLTNTKNLWSARIPNQNQGTKLHYYFKATANSGKIQVRPLPAPEAYFKTEICENTVNIAEIEPFEGKVSPNPANNFSVFSFENKQNGFVKIEIYNAIGERVQTVFSGNLSVGKHDFNLKRNSLSGGIYRIIVSNGLGVKSFVWVLI
jgi:agmatine deiminase